MFENVLTIEHRNRIEAIQRRVFGIIFGASDYLDFCNANGYSTLNERRDLLSRQKQEINKTATITDTSV